MSQAENDFTRFGHRHDETPKLRIVSDSTEVMKSERSPDYSRLLFDGVLGGLSVGILAERFMQALKVSNETSLIVGVGAGVLMGTGVIVHRIRQ